MSRLVESIRIENGVPRFLPWHDARINRTREDLFGIREPFHLETLLAVPPEYSRGLVKCRVLYDREVREIHYSAYIPRTVNSLKLVVSDTTEYSFKYEDRSGLEGLFAERDGCDDIIIVKNGLLTDTFAGNIVLQKPAGMFTPAKPLLPGTTRARLLHEGRIREKDLRPDDITEAVLVHIINAMVPLGQCTVEYEKIRF